MTKKGRGRSASEMTEMKWMRLLLTCLLLCSSLALASTEFRATRFCPACGHSVKVLIQMSHTSAGASRDLCRRVLGTNPVLLALGTCPDCLYTSWADDLPEKKPAHPTGRLSYLHCPTDQRPVPAWAQWQLRAQIDERKPKPDAERLLNDWMSSAWSVRLTSDEIGDKLNDQAADWFGKEIKQDQTVEWARAQAHAVASWPAEHRSDRALLAAAILRREGELLEVERLLPELPADLNEPLRASLARERDCFTHAEPYAATPANPVIIYLHGELLRRLGRDSEARAEFDRALANPKLGELAAWAREQKALCAPPAP